MKSSCIRFASVYEIGVKRALASVHGAGENWLQFSYILMEDDT